MQIVDAQIHLWGTGVPSIPVHWQVTYFYVGSLWPSPLRFANERNSL